MLARVEGNRVVVAFDEESSEAISSHLSGIVALELAARLNAFGLEDSRIDVLNEGVIRFLAFDTGPAENLVDLFETQGQIAIRPVIGRTENSGADVGLGNDLLPVRGESDSYFIVERRDIIEGQDFLSYESTFDLNGYPAISFRLNVEGAEKLTIYTQSELGGIVAVVLDDQVVATIINEVRIPANEGLIAGRFTKGDADKLVTMLNVGFFFSGAGNSAV